MKTSYISRSNQLLLFKSNTEPPKISDEASSTFIKNMGLPVHRWFRFSAGYSAMWAEEVISAAIKKGPVRVFDPFCGSGTTLLAAENIGAESYGTESHPFVYRIARAKLQWRSDPDAYLEKINAMKRTATDLRPSLDRYPPLIRNCFEDNSLSQLDTLRQAYEKVCDDTPASELAWLTLIGILRKVSKAGTAPWQYVLPKKQKRAPLRVPPAFYGQSRMIYEDMCLGRSCGGLRSKLILSDARTCEGVSKKFANLVVTSPPYPNNYDYADATRLEMSFMGEIKGWGDLQQTVRQYLIRSCSQHVPESSGSLEDILASPELGAIRSELTSVCSELAEIRKYRGGKKTYHLMVGSYFLDLANCWKALRGVCRSPARVCFVIGDSAPYGVYVPTIPWLGKLALAAGFKSYSFEKTRDRNVKWKNRKHRVPLQEGRLWVEG